QVRPPPRSRPASDAWHPSRRLFDNLDNSRRKAEEAEKVRRFPVGEAEARHEAWSFPLKRF
ncbi:MAG: hypothetical protein PHG96_11405, partial [Kiritimatiellae bacterium]|nr:hypothetical protein [Kiritimatiellia bacterium]